MEQRMYRQREDNRRQTATYVSGNTAHKVNVVRKKEVYEQRPLSKAAERNRRRVLSMSIGHVAFLTVMLAITGLVLVSYLQLQAEVTVSMKHVAELEKQVYNQTLENDETYRRINSEIDLEEIKRIAIQELGMEYAKEGQIVEIEGGQSDYVEQIRELPN